METENTEYFDLPVLLKQDSLNIRHVIKAEPSILVNEYFDTLSRFLKLVPDISGALIKFANLDADKDAYRSLDSAITLLEKLKCDKFILDFHSILDSYGKKGNWRESAVYAKRIVSDFEKFYSSIIAAKRKGNFDAQNLNDPSFKNIAAQSKMSLKELVKHLDEEEANRKLLILAVDDSPVILEALSHVLADTYKVFVLPKPTKLINVLQKLTPELFLLDYQMPELNGFELIPIIRSFEEHKKTPIIFLTSLGTVDNISTALALGACDFIVKPFKPDILLEKIAKHIVKKKRF
ncbi:MAG: response regulator [Azoarcus sp.]|jgi:CheY-like chemotaxis protein|nr:response regulator [Azoarcus sp.]